MGQKKHFTVTLARLVRETVTLTVEATSEEELKARLSEVYEGAEPNLDGHWVTDYEWGAEEGTHDLGDEVEDLEGVPDFKLDS